MTSMGTSVLHNEVSVGPGVGGDVQAIDGQ